VDFQREKILVREKPEHGNPLKKGAGREIEMHPRLKELLSAWRAEWEKLFDGEAPPHQWVFVNPANPKKRAEGFRTAFRHAREKAGLPTLRPCDLRHLFCSFALMNHVDKDVLRQWMGHKTFRTIDEVYSHFLADYRRQQMAKVQIALPSVVDGNVLPAPAEQAS
jgi:integrase